MIWRIVGTLIVCSMLSGCSANKEIAVLNTNLAEMKLEYDSLIIENAKLAGESEKYLLLIDEKESELKKKQKEISDYKSQVENLQEENDAIEIQLIELQDEYYSDSSEHYTDDHYLCIELDSDEVYERYGLPDKEGFVNLIQPTIDIYLKHNVSTYSLDFDNSVVLESSKYYRVVDNRFTSYEDYSKYISTYFCDELVENFLGREIYINYEGEVYTRGLEAGTIYDATQWHLAYSDYDSASSTVKFDLYATHSEYKDIHYDTMSVSFTRYEEAWKVSEFNYLF